MKRLLILAALLTGSVDANDVLDALEGKKKSSEINVPPAAGLAGMPAGDASGGLVYPEMDYPASPLDSLWEKSVIYKNDSNPWVQRMAVVAYFDQQASFGKAEVDEIGIVPAKSVDLDGTRIRRARLGTRIRAFRNTGIEVNYESTGETDDPGIERIKVRTELTTDTTVTFGKFRPDFGTEYSIEPEDFYYPDRTMLANMLAPDTTLGLALGYRRQGWEFGLGWFSRDTNRNIPDLEGDGSLLVNIKRTLVEKAGSSLMRATWHLDYLHNFDGKRSDTLPRFDIAGKRSANGSQLIANNPLFNDLIATGIQLDCGRFSFMGDFMIGKGEGDVYGVTLAPSYWAIPGRLNIVGRYHYAVSDEAGALITTFGSSSDPAFDDSPFFVGDEYNSFYLGTNLHLYRDKFVVMGGLEYGSLTDKQGAGFNTEAWTWHSGAKISF